MTANKYPSIVSQLPRQTGRYQITCEKCGNTVTATVGRKESGSNGFFRGYRTAMCRKCGTVFSGVIR